MRLHLMGVVCVLAVLCGSVQGQVAKVDYSKVADAGPVGLRLLRLRSLRCRRHRGGTQAQPSQHASRQQSADIARANHRPRDRYHQSRPFLQHGLRGRQRQRHDRVAGGSRVPDEDTCGRRPQFNRSNRHSNHLLEHYQRGEWRDPAENRRRQYACIYGWCGLHRPWGRYFLRSI